MKTHNFVCYTCGRSDLLPGRIEGLCSYCADLEIHEKVGHLVEWLLSRTPELTLYNRLEETQKFVASDGCVNASGKTLLEALRKLVEPG